MHFHASNNRCRIPECLKKHVLHYHTKRAIESRAHWPTGFPREKRREGERFLRCEKRVRGVGVLGPTTDRARRVGDIPSHQRIHPPRTKTGSESCHGWTQREREGSCKAGCTRKKRPARVGQWGGARGCDSHSSQRPSEKQTNKQNNEKSAAKKSIDGKRIHGEREATKKGQAGKSRACMERAESRCVCISSAIRSTLRRRRRRHLPRPRRTERRRAGRRRRPPGRRRHPGRRPSGRRQPPRPLRSVAWPP